MTSKAILTFGTDGYRDCLDVALPSMRDFADRHGYDLIHSEPFPSDRPVSWWKIPYLLDGLECWDEILWLDADVVIVDSSKDLDVPADAWQAMVEHHTTCGDVPNCGVWLLRQPMREVLKRAWDMTCYVNHIWWEQAAILDQLGYTPGPPSWRVTDTELYEHTFFLDSGWNVHPDDRPQPAHARIRHATCHPDRIGAMRRWAETPELAKH